MLFKNLKNDYRTFILKKNFKSIEIIKNINLKTCFKKVINTSLSTFQISEKSFKVNLSLKMFI